MFCYFKLNNNIYVEYDPYANVLYHWNSNTRIGKKDKVSKYVAQKLVANVLKPIHEAKFRKMFDRQDWFKTPKLEYISIKIEVLKEVL